MSACRSGPDDSRRTTPPAPLFLAKLPPPAEVAVRAIFAVLAAARCPGELARLRATERVTGATVGCAPVHRSRKPGLHDATAGCTRRRRRLGRVSSGWAAQHRIEEVLPHAIGEELQSRRRQRAQWRSVRTPSHGRRRSDANSRFRSTSALCLAVLNLLLKAQVPALCFIRGWGDCRTAVAGAGAHGAALIAAVAAVAAVAVGKLRIDASVLRNCRNHRPRRFAAGKEQPKAHDRVANRRLLQEVGCYGVEWVLDRLHVGGEAPGSQRNK
mmetsp:Transcript_73157/g.211697  ORF Transcript_73157/g.211697 Transcript_73157/m.211697 type:complete len:270 (-) Transcript_73157:454-1263(-)